MKKIILAIAIVMALCLPILLAIPAYADAKKEVDILFTHDLHSHLESFKAVEDGETIMVGGMARMKTLIDAQKEKNPNTILLDGGDFSMGTLIQTVYETQAAELRMMGNIGCDVTTLGNHEFDYRSKGLANMLNTAAESGEVVPAMVVCNVDWEAMEAALLTEGQALLKEGFDTYGVKEYVVLEKGDVKVAVMGIFGKDSLSCAPTCELIFKDPIEAAKATVKKIQEEEQVDMIACVSHGGTWEDASKSEDELLAKAVPEIDLIISGHTHSKLEEPIKHGNTYIVSCGEYGRRIGSIHMEQLEDGSWSMENYELLEVTMDIPENEEAKAQIEALKETVDADYLSRWNYEANQVIAQNEVAFSSLKAIEETPGDHNLGNIIADAYKYAVEHAKDFDGTEVAVAVAPSGTIRDSYPQGDITVADVFNSFSLGIGKDGIPGYPLLSVYLTGKELKLAAEIDASVSDYMTTARLYNAGLAYEFNPNRMLLNKVTDCYLLKEDGTREEIIDDKLYRVVSDLYSGQMLGGVTKMSFGLLKIQLKDEAGVPIESLEDAIIYVDGEELKAWTAIAGYMESFADTNGDQIANIPSYYEGTQGRKYINESKNLIELVKNPNKYAVMVVIIVLVLLAIILGIGVGTKKAVCFVIRKTKKK